MTVLQFELNSWLSFLLIPHLSRLGEKIVESCYRPLIRTGGLQRHSYLLEGCHGDPTPITRFNTPETYQLDLTSLRATIQPFAPSTKLSGAVMNRLLGTARYRAAAEAPAPEPGRFLPTSDYDCLHRITTSTMDKGGRLWEESIMPGSYCKNSIIS